MFAIEGPILGENPASSFGNPPVETLSRQNASLLAGSPLSEQRKQFGLIRETLGLLRKSKRS
jgi:hypothetical protein